MVHFVQSLFQSICTFHNKGTVKEAHQTFCWLVLFNPFEGLFISSDMYKYLHLFSLRSNREREVLQYVFYLVTHPHLYLSQRNLCSRMLKLSMLFCHLTWPFSTSSCVWWILFLSLSPRLYNISNSWYGEEIKSGWANWILDVWLYKISSTSLNNIFFKFSMDMIYLHR